MKRVHVFISGRVQGVSFRWYTVDKASSLGVTGWVRNTLDGRVEAVFEGEDRAVDEMVAWCGHGPPPAHVSGLEKIKEPFKGQFDRFGIEY